MPTYWHPVGASKCKLQRIWKNLIFGSIVQLWVVALRVAVVQEVVVDQVPTPALQEWVVNFYHLFGLNR